MPSFKVRLLAPPRGQNVHFEITYLPPQLFAIGNTLRQRLWFRSALCLQSIDFYVSNFLL